MGKSYTYRRKLKLQEERKQYNLYNGISFLLKLDDIYTVVLNICSSKDVETNLFYFSAIVKQNTLLKKYKDVINYRKLF